MAFLAQRRGWRSFEVQKAFAPANGIEFVGILLRGYFIGKARRIIGRWAVIENRKRRGGVAGIAHNYVNHKSLISEVGVRARTDDDISVTGFNVGNLDAYSAVADRETGCKGVFYR